MTNISAYSQTRTVHRRAGTQVNAAGEAGSTPPVPGRAAQNSSFTYRSQLRDQQQGHALSLTRDEPHSTDTWTGHGAQSNPPTPPRGPTLCPQGRAHPPVSREASDGAFSSDVPQNRHSRGSLALSKGPLSARARTPPGTGEGAASSLGTTPAPTTRK